MAKKKLTPRDKAIAEYKAAYERMYNTSPTKDLSGVETDEIWQMADEVTELFNLEALDSYEETQEEANMFGGAFSSLGALLDS